MLMKSNINPFESQETKPYQNDPRIAAMTDLVDAYQRDDIHRYESILQHNQDVLADPFIAENIDEITRNMRTKAVMILVAPYTRFALGSIAKQLSISVAEVEDIVGFLIMDGKIHGKINQEKGIVEIQAVDDMGRTQAMRQWTWAIGSLANTILHEGEGFKSEEFHGVQGPATSMHFHRTDEGVAFRGGVRQVRFEFGAGEKRGKEGSSRRGRRRKTDD